MKIKLGKIRSDIFIAFYFEVAIYIKFNIEPLFNGYFFCLNFCRFSIPNNNLDISKNQNSKHRLV